MPKKLLSFCLFLFLSLSTFGQVRGTMVSVTKPIPFNNNFENVNLDPTPIVGPSSRVQFVQNFNAAQSPQIGTSTALNLIGGNVSIPGWLNDLANGFSFFCSGVDPYFSINASIDVGGYYQVHSVGNSDVEIDYPIQVYITYPEANTFACGETIRINTNYTLLNPNATKLKVTPPFVNQEIGVKLDNLSFGASIGVNAWVGYGVEYAYPCPTESNPFRWCTGEQCGDQQYFNNGVTFQASTNLPQLPPLINVCEAAFGPNANNATLLGCNWSSLSPFLNLGQTALDAYNSTYNTNYTFAEFPNQHTVKIAPPDLADGPTIPEMEGTFKDVSNTELQFSLLNNGRKLKVNGNKSSISEMSFDLVSLLDYAGYTTSQSLGGGAGSIDIGDIAPTMTIDQQFDFEYDPIVHLQLDLGAPMNYTVFNVDNTIDHNGFGQMVQLIAGQYIEATIPSGQTAPMNASGMSNLDGQFKSHSFQEYFKSIQLAFGQVQLAGVMDFTLIETEILKTKFGEKDIIEHSFNLPLPTAISLPNFVIDPENPVIDVSYLQVEDIRNIGNGKRKVVYKVGLTNGGDVRLHNVQSNIDLFTAFALANNFQVECITSTDFIVNNGFNGSSDTNLLTANNFLEVGQTKYLEFVLEVTPEISSILANGCFGTVDYTIAAKATATSPIGTNIISDYNQCTMQTTGADINAEVDLGAAILTGLQDFTVYGWKGVVFDKPFTTSYGNVGSYSDAVFENVSFSNVSPATIVGDLHVKDRIRLIGESKVIVDYIQNTGVPVINNNQCGLFPTGTVSNNSTCVVSVPRLNITKPTNTSNENITIAAGTTRILNPGSYKTISVSENATLILNMGVYNIDTWRFTGDNAKVKYRSDNQNITIHVDKFQPLQRSNLEMILDGPGKVSDITLYAYGNQTAKFRNSFVQGVIVAPNTEVEFDNNSRLEGACYADKVNFKTGSVFKGTNYTLPLRVSSACIENSTSQSYTVSKTNVSTRNNHSIEVYPNPVTDNLTIDGLSDDVPTTIALYDTQGRLLRQFKANSSVFSFDMQDLNTGVYILIVSDSKETFKIVKK